jgi:hypothetical protein
MEDLIAAWAEFARVLNGYGKTSSLNGPCPPEAIRNAERKLGFELPPALATLLKLSDGQTPDSTGLFKSVSGWDVYLRHRFLGAEGLAVAYRKFVKNGALLELFGDQEIPFAVVGTPDNYREVFSVNRETGEVSLVETQIINPLLPWDWQIFRRPRAGSLAEFLRGQVGMYR